MANERDDLLSKTRDTLLPVCLTRLGMDWSLKISSEESLIYTEKAGEPDVKILVITGDEARQGLDKAITRFKYIEANYVRPKTEQAA